MLRKLTFYKIQLRWSQTKILNSSNIYDKHRLHRNIIMKSNDINPSANLRNIRLLENEFFFQMWVMFIKLGECYICKKKIDRIRRIFIMNSSPQELNQIFQLFLYNMSGFYFSHLEILGNHADVTCCFTVRGSPNHVTIPHVLLDPVSRGCCVVQ